MRNQENKNQLAFTFSPRRSASKISQSKQPLANLMATLQKQQHHTFSTLSQKYSSMEYSVSKIQVLLMQMGEKVKKFNESRASDVLANLRMKQSQFIISQLKNTIGKQSKKQEKIIEELQQQKKKSQKYREQVYKLSAQNSSLSQKIVTLEASIRKKTQQIQNYNTNLNKQREYLQNETRNRVKSSANRQSLMSIRSNEEYAELQQKIEQLEREFNLQIQKLVSKNNDLNQQIRNIQNVNYQYISSNKVLKKEIQELNAYKYELQIKLKQDSIQIGELQESYSKLVEKSNNNEIMLHKQLQDYKMKEALIKNEYKKEKKLFKSYLSTLAEYINSGRYYFTANHLKDQIQEMKSLFDKNIKKKLQNSARELDYYQAEYKKIKQKAEEVQHKLNQAQRGKTSNPPSIKQIQAEPLQKGERYSENGSLLHNRSGQRSEEQKYRNVEQKYKSKLQTLRKQVKAKQTKINQLQKMQQVEFDKNKEKILELQLQISQKTNEIRRCQLKFKEQAYETNELQSKIKELQAKIKFLTQRIESEKQSNAKVIQIKSQSYEQKMKLIKTNLRELQKKQQQKTIKYNKLKSRYEKYQLEATESLKRKNIQIDQLLKENNKLKTQNKLLQQKININQIIENQLSTHKTPNNNTNQDLIEQIEMERDRINICLQEKEKKIVELTEYYQKTHNDMINMKKQNRELKNKIEEMTREQRVLRQQSKYAKEKIEELSKNNKKQDEDKYNYFKKQLQKNLMANKKLQKACEKHQKQKQQYKKQVEQKQKEITNLKVSLEKAKQKKTRFQLELNQQRQSRKRLVVDYDRKLSQCATRQQQLVNIINYKNREGQGIRQSMKGQQLIIQEEAKIKFSIETMTQTIMMSDKGINTDHLEKERKFSHSTEKPIIPSELILNNQFAFEDSLEKQHQIETVKKQESPAKIMNYFGDLIEQNQQNHFDIGEEQQQIVQPSINKQLKQFFSTLRGQVEKLFNEQDISVQAVKLFPRQLEDDFTDFISYLKEKMNEIKNENNLTFIMAEAGNEPSNVEIQLQEFIMKPSNQYIQMKKIIEEKEMMITSLMNQKTQQENTINEQQNVQEQIERLHLQQYSVLKNQIHEQKLNLDKQLLYYQSLKNILKKMMNYWIEDEDNYDDFQDNLQLIPTIYKFNTKELELLKLYLKKYKQLKQI